MTTNPNQEPAGFVEHFDGGFVPTAHGIGRWLLRAQEVGATHMLVVCDTYDHGDYAVNVMPDEAVGAAVQQYDGQNMQRVMEVYWIEGDLEAQLAMQRCFVYGPEDMPQN